MTSELDRALDALGRIPAAMEEAEGLGYLPGGNGLQEPVSGGKPASRAPGMGEPQARAAYRAGALALRRAERVARMALREDGRQQVDPRSALGPQPYRSQVEAACAVVVAGLEVADRRKARSILLHTTRAWQVLARWEPVATRMGAPDLGDQDVPEPCPVCGDAIPPQKGRGRPRVTCGTDACRKEWRWRQAG